jgi:hypothetical protein
LIKTLIKKAKKVDSAVLAELARHLCPDNTLRSLCEEFEKAVEEEDSVCFIKYVGKSLSASHSAI